MLAAHENALVAALKAHRAVQQLKVRTVDSLPKLAPEMLLQRYATDAPGIYVLPGTLKGDGDDVTMQFVVVGVIRNAAGNAQARKGDGIDIGCDHLLIATCRALHTHQVGDCNWHLAEAAMVDDPIFDKAGVAAVEMLFQSTALQIPDDWDQSELDNFLHFHADIDIEPFAAAGAVEYASWLQDPPDFSIDRPDADLDVTLQGAT